MVTAERRVPRRNARSIDRWVKPLVFAVCLLPLAWLGWQSWRMLNGETDVLGANPIRELELQSGLWTLRFLAVALAVTPLRKVTGIGGLARYRRMLGLFVFFYACVHLSLWVGVDWFFDWGAMGEEIAKHKYILVGMATFTTLVPLAATSTKGWIRRLGGARWNRLHALVYASAVGGTVHYLWAVKKDTLFPLVYFAIFALLLGYRLWGRYARRATRSGPNAATQTPATRRSSALRPPRPRSDAATVEPPQPG